MKKNQNDRYESLKRVQQFNFKNSVPLGEIDEYADEVSDLNTTLSAIETADKNKAEDTSGDSSDKTKAREKMADTIIKYTLRAYVKAKRLGNIVLAKETEHTKSYILHVKDTDAITHATNLKNLMKDNLATLTNLDNNAITEMENAIARFTALKDMPAYNVRSKKASGTDLLSPLINHGMDISDNMKKLLHSYYSGSALADEFDLISQVITKGIHHSGAYFTITDENNNPIAGVVNTIASLDKTANTDIDGTAEIIEIKTGTYDITHTHPDYQPATSRVVIERGRIAKVSVMLKKK